MQISDSKIADQTAVERVSLDQVLRVAELAQLELTAGEQSDMLRDLNSILGYVTQLNQLDTSDVPAMAQGSEIPMDEPRQEISKNPGDPVHGSALRADVRAPSLDRGGVMAEAPESDGAYFKVPKVIER